jgi:hypothetical protein
MVSSDPREPTRCSIQFYDLSEWSTYFVPLDFTFNVILKASITFESTLYNFAEFLGKLFAIKEMVYSKARTRRFA